MGRNVVPPRGGVVRRWGRTSRSGRGQHGVAVWEHRSRPLTRVLAGLATLALLSVPSTAVRRTHEPAASRSPVPESSRARPESQPQVSGPAFAAEPVEHDAVIAPPPAQFDAPPAPAVAPPAALNAASAGTAGGVWAVVIGIDDYPGSSSDLRASVADANEVDAALAAYGVPADRRLVLRNTQATAGTVAESLRWLVAHASSDATAVFFYAGHVRKLSASTEAIVAADGHLVTDATMASLLRPLAAPRVWIAMASCYGGGFDELLAPGRILTGAAGPNSLAYENSRFGHSYLVEYMVHRAMTQRQAPGSVEQSFAWAADALRREYPNRVPVEYDGLDGDLRLGNAPPAAPAAPRPRPSGGGGGGGGSTSPPTSDPQSPPPDDDPCLVTVGSLVGCHRSSD
jgi:Caspase domain